MSDLQHFRDLGLSDLTIAALLEKGFEEPSPIQTEVIPKLLSGEKDLIGQAQTGTGKTAAFGLPILESIEPGGRVPQALILSPTRELCMQIAEELESLRGKRDVRIAALYGGEPIDFQLRALRKGTDIAVGTPGRVIDLIERQALELSGMRFFILDEADEMLNMGFVEDVETILASAPENKRMLMFSATMPDPILAIAEKFMRPGFEIVRTETEHIAVELTEQVYYEVRRNDKLEALSRLIDVTDDLYAMVFCRTKSDVDDLVGQLLYSGFPVEALHGDIAQTQRTKVISRFKEGKFKILIATDVAARGIDVNNLTHVINYSIPTTTEAYVHRIGRTGRAGKPGKAVTFVTPGEIRTLKRIMKEANVEIRKESVPMPDEVVEAKRRRVAAQLDAIVAEKTHFDYLPFAEQLLSTAEHPAETFAALLKLKFRDELLEHQGSGDINASAAKRDRDSSEMVKDSCIYLSIGRNDGFGPGEILDYLYQHSRVLKSRIGRIDLHDDYAFVAVDKPDAETIVRAIQSEPDAPRVDFANPLKGAAGPASRGNFRGGRPVERRSFARKPYEKRDGEEGGERRSYGRKPYGRRDGESGGERRSYAKKPYEKRGGEGGANGVFYENDAARPARGDKKTSLRDSLQEHFGGEHDPIRKFRRPGKRS